MRLRFTKMHGAGNDFVMIDGVRQSFEPSVPVLRQLASRHTGVGADQILLVESIDEPDVDFRYRIFNADGNEVEQCGNGARCFVRFVREQGLTEKSAIRVRTLCGVIEPVEVQDNLVRVDMGHPRFSPESVHFDSSTVQTRQDGDVTEWALPVGQETVWVSLASMGNPHAVHIVDDVDNAPVPDIGPLIEKHERFAQGVNAGFLQIIDRNRVALRVYERGVGETLACGSGACAAAVLAIRMGRIDSPVTVKAPGGELQIAWQSNDDQPVYMTGDATTVFEGEIEL